MIAVLFNASNRSIDFNRSIGQCYDSRAFHGHKLAGLKVIFFGNIILVLLG